MNQTPNNDFEHESQAFERSEKDPSLDLRSQLEQLGQEVERVDRSGEELLSTEVSDQEAIEADEILQELDTDPSRVDEVDLEEGEVLLEDEGGRRFMDRPTSWDQVDKEALHFSDEKGDEVPRDQWNQYFDAIDMTDLDEGFEIGMNW